MKLSGVSPGIFYVMALVIFLFRLKTSKLQSANFKMKEFELNHGLIVAAIICSAIVMNVSLTVVSVFSLISILLLSNVFIFKWKKK